MKGNFKKLIAILLALVAAFAAFACDELETPDGGKDTGSGTGDNGNAGGGSTTEQPESIDHTGTYYAVDDNGEFVDEKYYMTLKADGTFEVYGGDSGTYSISGETITMSHEKDSATASITEGKIVAGGVTYIKESIFKARSYTVKFVTNGGNEIGDVAATFGEKLTMPEEPKKDGYWFAGWYTTPELTGRYDKNALVRKSFTLYAKWDVAIAMPITGIDGSTDFDPDDETVDIYVEPDVTSFDFTDKVHIKDGWTWTLVNRDDEEIVNKTAENLEKGFTRVYIRTVSTKGEEGERYRIYIYRKEFVDVTFVSSRDESVLRTVKCKTYEPIPCPSDIKPDHYTITGWEYLHSESEYGKYYIAVNSETILKDDMVKDGKFTVRAIMTPDVYTVTMIDEYGEITDKDGNRVHKLTMSFDYEEYGQLPASTRYGYYFRGWYYGTGEDAERFTDESGDFRPGDLGKNITVYARWKLGYYFWYLKNTDTAAGSLSYNKEGGGASNKASMSTAFYYYGETMTVTAVPSDGYKFIGWYLSTDFGKTFIKVSEGDSLTLDCDWAFWVKYGEDIRYHGTLYARWEKIETAA